MNRLVLATRNAHKTRELAELLIGLPIEVSPRPPALPETVEDEPTLEGNAAKKARECAAATGHWSLADDTGLEVAALGGTPGVRSARYAGLGCNYADNNRKLLEDLKSAASRKAAFRTVMALSSPRGELILEQGVLEGEIAAACRGGNGFSYDPLFLLPAVGKTLAELSPEEKNSLSHRARALRAIVPHIRRAFGLGVSLLLACSLARATRAEPGQQTIWDEIMAVQAQRQLRVGAQYIDQRQYDAALKELQRAVAANPRDPAAQMMLGVAYYWTGDVDSSIECYRKSLALSPQDAQPHMLLGISLAYREQLPDAYAAFKKAAELDPFRADIQMNLGSVEDSMNRALDALEHFRRAVTLAPREALYHYQLGTFYRKLGRDQEAADSLRGALKNFPQFEDALLELGAVEERSNDRKSAMRDFKRAIELKSRDAVARFRLARLLLGERQARKAREVLAEAFHLTPEEGDAGLQLSISYAGGKSQGQAAKNDSPKPEPQPSVEPLSVFERNLDRIPLGQNALLQVDVMFVPKPKLTQSGPGEVSTLGRALKRELGDRPQIKVVRRQFRIDAGSQMLRERQIAQVLGELRRVMGEAPPEADVRLGMSLTFMKAAQTAAKTSADGGQARPKVSFQPRQVGNDLGLWIIGTGWMSLVEEVLAETADKSERPDDTDWWVTAGLGFATIGDAQRSLAAFERASELDARNEAAWLGLGVARVMMGDEKAAEAALERALKINPKGRAAAEGLKWLRRPSTRQQAAAFAPVSPSGPAQ